MTDAKEIIKIVAESGNRMPVNELATHLVEKEDSIFYDEEDAKQDIRKAINNSKYLVKDRFGGKDRIEKVVY